MISSVVLNNGSGFYLDIACILVHLCVHFLTLGKERPYPISVFFYWHLLLKSVGNQTQVLCKSKMCS